MYILMCVLRGKAGEMLLSPEGGECLHGDRTLLLGFAGRAGDGSSELEGQWKLFSLHPMREMQSLSVRRKLLAHPFSATMLAPPGAAFMAHLVLPGHWQTERL